MRQGWWGPGGGKGLGESPWVAEAGAGGPGWREVLGPGGEGCCSESEGIKVKPRSPSKAAKVSSKSSSSPSSSQAEFGVKGSRVLPAQLRRLRGRRKHDWEGCRWTSDDDDSQEPAGAGPRGRAPLLEWGSP